MANVTRFSISIEPELLSAFDRLTTENGFTTRSEALKQLIRAALAEKAWEEGGSVAGALMIVYDHHRRDLVPKLMDIQHNFGGTVISTQHVHLDHDNCLEVITLKGSAARVRTLASAMRALKGLKHVSLVTTAAGTD